MQSDLKIPSGHHLYKGEQFNFKPYACDLKINSEHLLSRGIHLAKFGNFEAKGPKDIKRTGMLSLFKVRIKIFPRGRPISETDSKLSEIIVVL